MLDIYFNVEENELDEFLDEISEELETKKENIIQDCCVVVDGVIETDINKYKHFYFEIDDFDVDFEEAKEKLIEKLKDEIEKYL